jgi:hypothetical protein
LQLASHHVRYHKRAFLKTSIRRIAEARKRGELPPAEEGCPLTEFDQGRLEILKHRMACQASGG